MVEEEKHPTACYISFQAKNKLNSRKKNFVYRFHNVSLDEKLVKMLMKSFKISVKKSGLISMVVYCKDNSLNWNKLKSDIYGGLTCKYKTAIGSVFQCYCMPANKWQPSNYAWWPPSSHRLSASIPAASQRPWTSPRPPQSIKIPSPLYFCPLGVSFSNQGKFRFPELIIFSVVAFTVCWQTRTYTGL